MFIAIALSVIVALLLLILFAIGNMYERVMKFESSFRVSMKELNLTIKNSMTPKIN